MNLFSIGGTARKLARSNRFHLWRSRKDRAARWLIALGGVTVLFFVVLIFFYLVWVVVPLFLPASVHHSFSLPASGHTIAEPVLLAADENAEVGFVVEKSGTYRFLSTGNGQTLDEGLLALGSGSAVSAAAVSSRLDGSVAYAADSGEVFLVRQQYETRFAGGVETRRIEAQLDSPWGDLPLLSTGGVAPALLAFSSTDSGLVVAAATADGRVWINRASLSENFLSGETVIDPVFSEIQMDARLSGLAVSADLRWLYLGDEQGRVLPYDLVREELGAPVESSASPVTAMTMLTGGDSLLTGRRDGSISQVFPVNRGAGPEPVLVRRFEGLGEPVAQLLPERYRKGFLAIGSAGALGIYHATAERTVLRERGVLGEGAGAAALSARSNRLLALDDTGGLDVFAVDNRHPEVSWSSLWRAVWYENYPEPRYVWQTSAASSSFEPKFSLTPLVFGTLKAAVYAMLFAVPLALMAAVYSSYFMAPMLRKWLKPTIEMMAAMPTVILGFLAGLWFAPLLEENLAGFFLVGPVLLAGLVLFAVLRGFLPAYRKHDAFRGREPLMLLPVIAGLIWLALWLGDPVQAAFFAGDMRLWLEQEAGISYDQRNSLVVGIAMGFAVIPIIFSLSEDALHDVPASLSSGSLALGATPWQTLSRVIFPVALPGIFSALMIGMGRAVGETMIILMATGNTPIMDWNVFEGMRTLAANIAIEMPESELNSSHYRILFLSALVLFAFTFVVNTAAELIRQRLRSRYKAF